MKNNFKPLYNDIVFNYVFSHKEFALDFVKTFFNLTNEHIDIKVKNEYVLPKTKFDDKALRTDIIVTMKSSIINLEVYTCFNQQNIEKSKQYATRLYSTQLNRGDRYLPKKVIQINICKTCPLKDKELLNHYGILDYKTGKPNMFGNDLDIYVVCLDKMNKEEYNVGISDRLSKYFMMFINEDYEKSKKITEGDDILMSIQDCVKRFMNDENTNRIFNHEKKIKDEYLEVGREQGHLEGQLEIAKNLLKENININIIANATGLSVNKIKALKV